jgi:hypothetical protein
MPRKIVIVPDLRIPNEDQSAIGSLARFIAEYKPDELVIVGEAVSSDRPTDFDRLRDIISLFRQTHDGPIGIHPGRKLSRLLRGGPARSLVALRVTVLPTVHAVTSDWLSTHGEDVASNTFPGGKAITLARKVGKNVVCGTGGHAVIVESTGPSYGRGKLYGMEAGSLSRNARPKGFSILECEDGSARPVLVAITPHGLTRTVQASL